MKSSDMAKQIIRQKKRRETWEETYMRLYGNSKDKDRVLYQVYSKVRGQVRATQA